MSETVAAQGLSPTTPSKEYIRLNGQVVAIENAPSTPDFAIGVSPSSLGVTQGNAATYTATITAVNGYSGSPSFSVGGLPAGASGSFSPNPVSVSGGAANSTLTISTSGGVTPGSYTFTVTAQSGALTHSATAVLVVQAAFASSALQFVPITPCRLVDTRGANGAFGGPSLTAQSVRSFVVSSGGCGVPSSAQAYSMNVSAVPSDPTYLTVWPAGQPQPGVSSLNSPDGRVKGNAAIVGAGSGGAIDVYTSGDTQLILDINGYFVPPTGSSLAFYPITPCRAADTRGTNGALGGPYLGGGSTRAFPILSSGCGVPSSAQAYSLNLTALPHGLLTYLVGWATGQAQPGTGSLSGAPTATATANAAIVAAGKAGQVSIYTSDDTDLMIDINGYFAPPGAGGLSLYTLTAPCRVYDSRASQASSGIWAIAVSGGACGLPNAPAYVLNAVAVPSGSLGYLELWPNGQTQPVYSTLNAGDSAVTSNMAVAGSADGWIQAYASSATYLILDAFGYFAP